MASPSTDPGTEKPNGNKLPTTRPSLSRKRKPKPASLFKTLLARLLKTILIIFVLYTVIGFIIVPGLITRMAPLISLKGSPVNFSLRAASFNPYNLILELHDLAIAEAPPFLAVKEPMLKIGHLKVDLEISSLFDKALICRGLSISGLSLHLIRKSDAEYNVGTLIPVDVRRSGKKILYRLQNISLRDSKVVFDDLSGKNSHRLEDIFLQLPVLTNLTRDPATPSFKPVTKLLEPEFSAVINGRTQKSTGKTVASEGKIKTLFEFEILNIDLPELAGYFPSSRDLHFTDGSADVILTLLFSAEITNSNMNLQAEGQIRNLSFSDKAGNSTLIPSTKFRAELSPGNVCRFLTITADNPLIQFTGHLPDPSQAPISGNQGQPALFPWPDFASLPQLEVDSLAIRNGSLINLNKDEAWTAINLDAIRLSTVKDQPGEINLTAGYQGQGKVTFQGSASLNPFALKLDYTLAGIPTLTLRPLFSVFIQPNLDITEIEAYGKLTYPDLYIEGTSSIKGLSTEITPGRNLFECPEAVLGNFRMFFSPPTLAIDELIFDQPHFKVQITDRKRPALSGFLFPVNQPEDDTYPPLISVDNLEIVNGFFKATDMTSTPPLEISINALTVSMSEMTNQPASPAPFTMEGNLSLKPSPDASPADSPETPAKIKISGQSSLFGSDPAIKSTLEAKKIHLKAITPYLAPVIGYQTEKGVLHMVTDIDLHGRKIISRNKFTVSGFGLGDNFSGRFNTPLAIALLTDRKSRINFDIPVSGNIGSPRFSYTKSLANALRKILARTTSAPFSLLPETGETVEHLGYITFAPGDGRTSENQLRLLNKLAKSLNERPLLMVAITGYASPGETQGDLKELADRRGKEVRDQLAGAGLKPDRMRLDESPDIEEEETILDLPAARVDLTLFVKDR